MTVTASMVKELRERTGAGMMECKKALEEAKGDFEEAIVQMRKRGQAKAAKRAGKIAAEGAIVAVVSSDRKKAVILEVNSETDFVARDSNFKDFTQRVTQRALAENVQNVETLLSLPYQSGSNVTIEQARQELMTKIGENIQLRRMQQVSAVNNGTVGVYSHGDRIGVLVAINQDNADLLKDIAMHIAASSPRAIESSEIPKDVIERERDIYTAQAKETGKPDDIIEKMVAGRIAKFLKESCLVGQPFVKNPDQTVGNLLDAHQAKVTQFVRFEVGEGIEKETHDFAAEVQAQVQGSE